MPSAEPFRVAIPEDDLDDLRRRLRRTRWPEDPGNADWSYGVERGWLQEMVAYWAEEFDWRAQEAAMNRFPQFRVVLDGIPIHFLHVRSARPDATPVILTHGWPWTFWDFKDVIAPLAETCDVIVPSLPGFGFSAPLRTAGVDPRRIAGLWTALMRDVLGYDTFVAAGGDWGSIVSAEIGHAHGEHVRGVWLTLPMVPGFGPRHLAPETYGADERWMLDRMRAASRTIRSHRVVAQHEPQTLAYALADSPVGTAAWLWQRRRDWSDCDGDVLAAFDRDFLCTTASIAWLAGTVGTSLRIYAEHFRGGPRPPLHDRLPAVDVPTAFSIFPKEVVLASASTAARLTRLHRWTVQPRGGHFAPAEQPELVARDIAAFVASLPRS